MKNKTKAMTLLLIMAITARAFTQQYDSESDFEVQRKEDSITITKYLGSKTEVRIPPVIQNLPVTVIGALAFFECAGLVSVTIPDSVTSIGDYAFAVCTSLTSVIIPDSVTSIGDGVFYYCESLVSITIPNSVTVIGTWAFPGCISLTSITIPDGVTNIDKGAFYTCKSLTSVIIPNGVTGIGDVAFAYCASLTSVTFKGTIELDMFSEEEAFPGDLRAKYFAEGIGTYTRKDGASKIWTKQ